MADRKRWWVIGGLIAICWLALGVRVHELTEQSMWSDEGLSWYRAGQPAGFILSNTITIDGHATTDTNPPLYFLLLHLFGQLTGMTVFTLRYAGVIVGLVSVPFIYLLGRQLGGSRVGLVAAFLLAIAPLHVWQSQEMRNYPLLLLWNLLAVYGSWRVGDGWRWWLIWLVGSVAGVLTHYFGFFVLAYTGLVVGWFVVGNSLYLWVRHRLHSVSAGGKTAVNRLWIVTALVGLVAILMPIVLVAWRRFRGGQQVDFVFVPLIDFVTHALSAFSVGVIPDFVQPLWRVAPAVTLVGIGLWRLWRRDRMRWLMVVGYGIVPLGVLWGLSTVNPLYNGVRHLLIGLPPFLLLMAAGVGFTTETLRTQRFWRVGESWLRWGLFLVVVVSQVAWLGQQFDAPELVKDDVRGAAEFLSEVAQPADFIILHDTILRPTFEAYYDGVAPVVSVPQWGEFNIADAEQRLAELGTGAARVWFVTSPSPRTGFPRQRLTEWAEANWARLGEYNFEWLWLGMQVRLYAGTSAVQPAGSNPTPLTNNLTLLQYEAPATATRNGYWQPVFYWQKSGNINENYTLSLSFLDDAGRVWAQVDQPLWSKHPPAGWPIDEPIRYAPLIALPAGLPPATYQTQLRLLHNGQPIHAPLELGMVAIPASTDPTRLVNITPADTIFGRQIRLLGSQIPTDTQYRPGHVVPVTVYWQAIRFPRADYIWQVQLLDEAGQVVSEARSAPSSDAYPSTAWGEGEILQGLVGLTIPAQAETGRFSIRTSLLDPTDLTPLSTGLFAPHHAELATVNVEAWPLVTELPPIPYPQPTNFGDPTVIVGEGYDLNQTATTLEVTLFWRTVQVVDRNYAVFVHLVDEAGAVVAQGDGPPLAGLRPTGSWRPSEVLVDEHVVDLMGLPAGSYTLQIGFYDPANGTRLAVDGGRWTLATPITIIPRQSEPNPLK